ncbi:hypothetical protein NQ317_007968 [Molorchus minor]|uniref:Uncharacterized protein n=1 Tax=Molorchus minor TaxID=1323400 RepID=A0ABQ9JK36_9CUCU|nr:hypothetical protein NQ317_007968 [Molorchus minor]
MTTPKSVVTETKYFQSPWEVYKISGNWERGGFRRTESPRYHEETLQCQSGLISRSTVEGIVTLGNHFRNPKSWLTPISSIPEIFVSTRLIASRGATKIQGLRCRGIKAVDLFSIITFFVGRLLPLYGEPSGVERENVHHTNKTIIRSNLEDCCADMQKARGYFPNSTGFGKFLILITLKIPFTRNPSILAPSSTASTDFNSKCFVHNIDRSILFKTS